ncbi:hypothetical protein GCM10027416_15980 [Okibacterium endophyticum]
MSDSYPAGPGVGGSSRTGDDTTGAPGGSGTMQTAREEASHLREEAASTGRDVADTAKSEASHVAEEAKTQAKDLWSDTRAELHEQAQVQQKRVASGLRSLGDELETMAAASDSNGTASRLVQGAAGRAESVASWLDERDPGSLVDEVSSFARRRPGMFIALAVGAGLAAGRLTRSLKDDAQVASGSSPSADSGQGTQPGASGERPSAPAGAQTPPPPATEMPGGTSGLPSAEQTDGFVVGGPLTGNADGRP